MLRVPGPDELEGRLGLVLHVVYLIFTEGYAAARRPALTISTPSPANLAWPASTTGTPLAVTHSPGSDA